MDSLLISASLNNQLRMTSKKLKALTEVGAFLLFYISSPVKYKAEKSNLHRAIGRKICYSE